MPIAEPATVMARRVTAMIGIVILLGLVFALAWRVYLHREAAGAPAEPAMVSVQSLKNFPAVIVK